MSNDNWMRQGRLNRRDALQKLAMGVALVGCDSESLGGGGSGAGLGSGGAGPGATTGAVGSSVSSGLVTGSSATATTAVATTASVGPTASSSSTGSLMCPPEPTPGCLVTDDNILGPFYKAGAPFDSDLADNLMGQLLLIEGTVFGCDCVTPLADAVVDVWQADSTGAYDNVGFLLRGKVRTDAAGRYSFLTVVPGWYLNGAQFRPAHVHYKVTHPAGLALTTQLYFEGDPYLDIDPFVKPSLIKPMTDAMVKPGVQGKRTGFDIVLGAT